VCRACEPPIETLVADGYLRARGVRCEYAGPDLDVARLTIRRRMPASGPALAMMQPGGLVRLVRLPPGHDAAKAASEAVRRHGLPVAVAEVAFIGTGKDDVPETLLRASSVLNPIHTEAQLFEGTGPTGPLGRLALVRKAKPLDPLDPNDFDLIVAALSKLVRESTIAVEARGLAAWAERVAGKWTTPAQLDAAARSLEATIKGMGTPAWEAIRGKLRVSAQRTATGSRRSTIKQNDFKIPVATGVPDRRAIDRAVDANVHFVRDYYGNLAPTSSAKMRGIVADGIEQGLSTTDIGRNVRRGLTGHVSRWGDSYYDVVSSAVTGRSRSYSLLGSFRDAGISTYRYEAVQDEKTTPTCAFLHGKEMDVAEGLARYDAADQHTDPQKVRDEMPWTTQRVIQQGADTGKEGIYIQSAEGLKLMAVIERPPSKDNTGSYSRGMSTTQLRNAHIGPPPLHSRCRTTLLAVV
jgi:hypothetical protein